MIKHIVGTVITVAALGLCMSSFAAGNGGGGSHGGGSSGGNSGGSGAAMSEKTSHGSDNKSHSGAKEARTGKTPSQQLTDNKKLSATLAGLLPAGTDLQAASAGFKKLGQFVAAVHVSKNLGIPFTDLKDKMMNGDSLGTAIKTLKPTANAELETKKARKQAAQDTATAK